MSTRPARAVLIGLDGANYEAMRPLMARNLLPNLSRLIGEGVRCENAYAPYPTLTGSNWASIATGAWPGTHGVTDMSYHVTGEPIDHWHSGFTSDAVEAETLWETLARAGKKSIVLKYTGTWPPRRPDVVMVDGGGGRSFWGGAILELSHSQLFSAEAVPNGNQVRTAPAEGWAALPHSTKPPIEFRIKYQPETGRIPDGLQFDGEPVRTGKGFELWGLVIAEGQSGYDTINLHKHKSDVDAWITLGSNVWSGPLEVILEIDGRAQRTSLRVILDHLDPETGDFSLYFSQAYPTDGFAQPSGLGAELVEKFGPYFNHPGFSESAMGWFRNSPETFLKLMEYQNEWLGRAGRHLMETKEWDFFAMQCDCIDFANHTFVPRRGWSDAERGKNPQHFARCYQSVDRMVGELIAGAGDEALVCVISDHGATASPCPEVFINPILEEAGLLAYEESGDAAVRPRIDMSRTIALQQRAAFIYLNVKGRDPRGIIDPGEYEEARDKVIAALRAWREPTTGRNPFSMILRKEDARLLGLYDSLGRDIGDVVYALLPEFDHEHGRQLPGATLGGQTMKPLMLFHGPGIKKATVLKRTAWIIDAVPTLAHVMDWPIPSEAEGAVLYQALAGHTTQFPRPDFLKKQEKHLHKIRERLGTSEESPATKPAVEVSPKETPVVVAPVEPPVHEELHATIEGLQSALREALAEANKWKTAYEQYHRITHGN